MPDQQEPKTNPTGVRLGVIDYLNDPIEGLKPGFYFFFYLAGHELAEGAQVKLHGPYSTEQDAIKEGEDLFALVCCNMAKKMAIKEKVTA